MNSRILTGRRADRPPFPANRHFFIANTGELSIQLIQLQGCVGQTYKSSRVHNTKWNCTLSIAMIGQLPFIGKG